MASFKDIVPVLSMLKTTHIEIEPKVLYVPCKVSGYSIYNSNDFNGVYTKQDRVD